MPSPDSRAEDPGPQAQASHAGKILCLEDVNEPAYALDRALTQLLHSRALDGVAGIVLGSSQGCRPEPLLRDVFRERLTPLGVPVAWELGFGHGPSSLALPPGRSRRVGGLRPPHCAHNPRRRRVAAPARKRSAAETDPLPRRPLGTAGQGRRGGPLDIEASTGCRANTSPRARASARSARPTWTPSPTRAAPPSARRLARRRGGAVGYERPRPAHLASGLQVDLEGGVLGTEETLAERWRVRAAHVGVTPARAGPKGRRTR
ncbi:hypothetical protein ACFV47_21680 [Streptomyces solisilvae]|uniref:hypothetical protein n=1 Tax=Streptomyces malaysiensis TaxID=92644 RepID=UPI0036A5BCDD